jgi:hypothetical protein
MNCTKRHSAPKKIIIIINQYKHKQGVSEIFVFPFYGEK